MIYLSQAGQLQILGYRMRDAVKSELDELSWRQPDGVACSGLYFSHQLLATTFWHDITASVDAHTGMLWHFQ